MKRFYLCLFLFSFVFLNYVFAQEIDVFLTGMSNQTSKAYAETNISKLINAINISFNLKQPLNLNGVNISPEAAKSLDMLWDTSVFHCVEDEIVEEALIIGLRGEYEVRNIPFLFEDLDEDDRYHEVAITFTKSGSISSFRLVLDNNLYRQVITSGSAVTDIRRRQLILDYVEQFRTSYNTKDLVFLNQVFSDDALIITGRVINSRNTDSALRSSSPRIEYTKQNKAQYISKLSRIFKNNKRVHVTFDKIKVMCHPVNADWYGVTLHQGYSTDSYHDDGWVFLLWDFTIEDAPVIHVRTWQPDAFEGRSLDEDEIFGIDDFNIFN